MMPNTQKTNTTSLRIARILFTYIIHKGITERELAKHIQIHHSILHRTSRSKTIPNISASLKIFNWLNTMTNTKGDKRSVLSEVLLVYMAEYDLAQTEVADQIGISNAVLHRILMGYHKPSTDTALKIFTWLMTDHNHETTTNSD